MAKSCKIVDQTNVIYTSDDIVDEVKKFEKIPISLPKNLQFNKRWRDVFKKPLRLVGKESEFTDRYRAFTSVALIKD